MSFFSVHYFYIDMIFRAKPYKFAEDFIQRVVDSNAVLCEMAESFSYDVIMYGEHGQKALASIKVAMPRIFETFF